MSEYTPSTEDIKWEYRNQCNQYYADCEIKPQEHAEEFDRWLAKHDAEVAKAERERIIEIAEGHRHVYSEEHFDCDVCVTLNQLIALIKGEKE